MINKKIYFVALQALGDNLVSLSLLSQLSIKVNVLGTKHTESIVNLVDLNKNFNVEKIFEDIPAFYDIRKQGFLKSIKDTCSFRNYIKQHDIKELVFEKKDYRVKLLTCGLNVKTYSSDDYHNVYFNRKYLIQDVYKEKVEINDKFDCKRNIRTVLINPVTRVNNKNIIDRHLELILIALKKHGIKIQLIDYNKDYHEFRNKVDQYFTNTSLKDVKNLINSCDLYLGADSFLVHLAYYCNKPFFIIFNHENKTFLPPLSEVIDNYIVIDDSVDFLTQFNNKISLFLLP